MSYNFSDKRISRNVVATVSQVLISGIVFFVLYRYLYDQLGVEQIGVWALVLAATSVSRIGELGLSAGVVRFVAHALGRNDVQHAADVVQTVALTLGAFMAVLLIVGYPLFILALSYFIPKNGVLLALGILPYALISLWTMVIVSVFSGGLDGCMRMDLRSFLMGLSHLVYLGLTMLLVPDYGLEGVAMAQLIQTVGLMIMLWWALKTQLRVLPLLPIHWKFPVLKEMFIYGVSFQVITIMNMLFDPMIKALMSKFGGLEALGYYEMANKLILQGRGLIVEASRVMVPVVASIQKNDKFKSKQLFVTSYNLTLYVSIVFYGLLGIFMSIISLLWLGSYQTVFITFALLLNFGWFANTLIGPAYFSNLGSGHLRPNMVSHIIISVCGLFIGVWFGSAFGGVGVVIGAVTGLVSGSMFLLISYVKKLEIYWPTFIAPKGMVSLFIFSGFLIALSNYIVNQNSSSIVIITIPPLCGIILLSLGWFNPARKMYSSRG